MRVPLHGRRVGGWVVALGSMVPEVPVERLLPIARWSGRGPDAGLVDLASWAAHRWAGRRRSLLVTASPPGVVGAVPPPNWTRVAAGAAQPVGTRLVRVPPTLPLVEPLLSELDRGPVLAVVPEVRQARAVAARLRRLGRSVAVWPDEWARAAGGVDVVVGARSAAWARCRELAGLVVLDEHDEALQEERNPTWHARDVMAERARRLGVPFSVVSPCPSAVAVHRFGPAVRPPRDDERAGWPLVDVIDRTEEEPWRRSLVTPRLQAFLRDPSTTVVCVLNTKGRARLVACGSCRELQSCEHCGAAVALDGEERFHCRRCGTTRPQVCPACGSSAMRLVRPGINRLREELEVAAHRPVVAVDASVDDVPEAGVYVGTEAVLHRVRRANVVALLDIDNELLATRYRAAEQALALLVRAGRVVGPRSGGGRVLVQTCLPRHEVLRAALLADPAVVTDAELARRATLGFPPFAAIATLEGPGAADAADALCAHAGSGVRVLGPAEGRWLVRAPDERVLADALAAALRTVRSRVRVEVDPPRV